jgi:hypothetical protein
VKRGSVVASFLSLWVGLSGSLSSHAIASDQSFLDAYQRLIDPHLALVEAKRLCEFGKESGRSLAEIAEVYNDTRLSFAYKAGNMKADSRQNYEKLMERVEAYQTLTIPDGETTRFTSANISNIELVAIHVCPSQAGVFESKKSWKIILKFY